MKKRRIGVYMNGKLLFECESHSFKVMTDKEYLESRSLDSLDLDLKIALDEERYKDAAKIRDEINRRNGKQ
jgi:protein-arginine kinase activator protein McsA